LQWAREHGCPWDSVTCIYAVQNRRIGVLRWAIEHGCPGGADHVHYLTQAWAVINVGP